MLFLSLSSQAGFLIYPQKIIFDGKQKKKSIKLSNMTDEIKTYRIKVVNYHQKQGGGYERITSEKDGVKFAEPYLRFSPKKVILKPRETQTVNVMVKKKSSLQAGEYRSHLSIIEKENSSMKTGSIKEGEMGFTIKADYGITIPVIIRQGTLDLEVNIKNVSLDEDKDEHAFIEMDIHRKGSKSFRGEIRILDGEKEVGILKNVVLYTNLNTRKIKIKLYNREEGDIEPLEISDLSSRTLKVVLKTEETKGLKVIKEFEL